MNAPVTLEQLQHPDKQGLRLRLRTLTPLYTGGIGQQGEQLHPSNLLGGLRHMSCMVARTLGVADFESQVWGTTGQAKQIGLHWDTRQLKPVSLPDKIDLPRRPDGKQSRWYFNTAHVGELGLSLTRRGISDLHWQILRIALAIQIRHGSFGSKDQFGLGVLERVEGQSFATPLDVNAQWEKANLDEASGKLNLLRTCFIKVGFRHAPGGPRQQKLDRTTALKLGLATRATLRNALRARDSDPQAEKDRLTLLRHRMLGELNKHGSAINVSAAYGEDDAPELRIAILLKSEGRDAEKDKDERNEIIKRLVNSLGQVNDLIDTTGYKYDKSEREYGGTHAKDKAAWLNTLAGVAP
ncbi:MAG: hypothetical protein KBD39_04860 [Sterolibacterium sp.]|nr:hypothetical protein [Sterolibacterium sp.]MBP9799431.1 hypothetical protein [Sterolibacterium sp.]